MPSKLYLIQSVTSCRLYRHETSIMSKKSEKIDMTKNTLLFMRLDWQYFNQLIIDIVGFSPFLRRT